jgi:hypothetical protein
MSEQPSKNSKPEDKAGAKAREYEPVPPPGTYFPAVPKDHPLFTRGFAVGGSYPPRRPTEPKTPEPTKPAPSFEEMREAFLSKMRESGLTVTERPTPPLNEFEVQFRPRKKSAAKPARQESPREGRPADPKKTEPEK